MVKTLIFDFGDVFINLDKAGAMTHALDLFKLKEFPEPLFNFNCLYEQGLVSTDEFLEFYESNFPHLTREEIIFAWNFILKDFPIERLEFIQNLRQQNDYKLILLSNTNTLHIDWIKEHVSFYEEFKKCFHAFYLSQEIQLRKPNLNIYSFVLDQHDLKANECLFIDDTKENTIAAEQLGIHTWNINPETDEVSELFTTKKQLF